MPVATIPARTSTRLPFVLLALAVTVGACGGAAAKRAGGAPPPVPVTLGRAVVKTVPVTVRAIGQVEPIANVAVRSRVSGELQNVHFSEGQSVHAGQVLFTIDPRPAQAALAQAEAQLARDSAALAQAEADVARYARLVADDFVTRQQFDQANTTVATLKAGIAADRASIETARLQLAYSTITAPVGGRTGNLQVKQGNLVQSGDGKVLVTINQTRPIYASFSVPAQVLPAILARRGERMTVTATPSQVGGTPAEGVLSFIDNSVDTATSTVLLKATFANQDESLWPGQFVDVTMTIAAEPNRVVVPAGAVQIGQQGAYVFVVGADSTAELRLVTVARQDVAEAVIASGLDGTETVVIDGQLRLVPGSRVQEVPAVGGNGAPATAGNSGAAATGKAS